ncbi:hypothetical protein C8R46DRAFT_1083536 [Mycena filopes]|nr:hypothetical protein C8R46DRAFT_1083536 [Mycena filopes]
MEKELAPYSTLHLQSLSLVCRQLRRLCAPRMFSCLKIRHTEQLRLLNTKCLENSEFGGLIRRLDLGRVMSPEERADATGIYRYGLDILPPLLPRLPSLQWLYLGTPQLSGQLLTALNAHPKLATIAICDMDLETLRTLSASTTLSLSKIRVHFVVSELALTLGSAALHSVMSRSPRLVHLSLRGVRNIKYGPGPDSLFLTGLEKMELGLNTEPTYPMSWLPGFVARHASLQTISFHGCDSLWRPNLDITFPLQFLDAVARKSLARTIELTTFSIHRPSSASALLDEWQTTELDVTIDKGAGIAGLTIASSLAPHTLVLIVRMSRFAKQPVHLDDVVSSLSLFPSLQRLELHCLNRHLLYEGCPPWVLPPPHTRRSRKTSRCTGAHAAVLWIAAQVAHAVPLESLRITDEGTDVELVENTPCFTHRWRLEATYQIRRNRDLEFHGIPELHMAERYRRSAISRPVIYGRELRPAILYHP